MAVLFQANELEDWGTVLGAPSLVNNYSHGAMMYLANVRCGIQFNPGSPELSSALLTSPTFSATEFWFGFHKYIPGLGGATRKMIAISGGGSRRIGFGQATSGTWGAYTWNGSVWTLIGTAAADSFCVSPNLNRYDFKIKLGNPGQIRIYKNGVSVMAITPDLSFSGLAAFDKIELGCTGDSYYYVFSEFICATWNTIGSKLVTRIPDANGNYTSWTNGAYTVLDEQDAATDFASSNTADQRTSYLFTDVPALGAGESIDNVKVVVTATRDGGGPQNINHFCRIGSTDYDQSNQSVSISQVSKFQYYDTSPATAAAWTVAGVNAAQFGFRSRA